MSEIYYGRGNAAMRDDYLDFINLVFGFNGNQEDFLKLLPKLYKEEYHPCENNYICTEDGKLRSAIGVFPRQFDVCGEVLTSAGVGNVAVHPYTRSKGYMRKLLGMAVQDMIATGADMSDLGGLRQRYAYFSYESAAPTYRFEINRTSLRHCFENEPLRTLTFAEVNSTDDKYFDEIFALYETKISRVIRPREQFMDIAHSWCNKLWAVVDGEKFIGYFIDKLAELTLVSDDDFHDVVRNFVAQRGDVSLRLPLYAVSFIRMAEKICGSSSMGNEQNYTVFHWKKVVAAYLKLKATTVALCDGSRNYLVHGIAGDEAFTVTVKDGVPTVTDYVGDDAIVLPHLEAVTYFFSVVSPRRMTDNLATAWYPLPLFVEAADHV